MKAKKPKGGATPKAESSHAKVLTEAQKKTLDKLRIKAESILKKHREVQVVLSATPALRDWVPKVCSSVVTEVVAELELQLADIEMHVGPAQQPCVFADLLAKYEKVCKRGSEKIAAFHNYVKDGEKDMEA